MKATVAEHGEEPHLSYRKYLLGFVSSLALTVGAYLLATNSTVSKTTLALILAAFALTQFIVQMVLFLHIAEERGPRWKLGAALMMLIVVLILVFASIWIMNNLNYRMTPQQIQQYLKSQDNL